MRGIIVRRVVLSAAILAIVPFLAWAGGAKEVSKPNAAAAASGSLPRNETLYVGGFQWGPPTSFNPVSGNPAWPVGGDGTMALNGDGYVYETLFDFNIVDGQYAPDLGKSMQWTTPSTLVVKLQPGTMWQDGQALTAKDVVFTFELAKKFTLPYSPIWSYISSVKALDSTTVEFDMTTPNQGAVDQYMATVYILPEHIWSPMAAQGQKALLSWPNFNPVGSGQYTVKSYSPQQVVLQQASSYWGSSLYGTVVPKYVVHPIFKSNDDGNLALKQAELDLSQQFVPNVWTIKNVQTWYNKEPYYVPGTIPNVIFNVEKPGLNNVLVRKAIAYAMNYGQAATVAMSHYSLPADPSLIIPTGYEAKYLDKSNIAQYGWKYDPQKAIQILQDQLHATKGPDGIYVLPDGTKLSFTAETPYGWTDWMAALQVLSQSAKAVGIQITTKFPQAPVVTSDVETGNFDMAMRFDTGTGPASPWQRFHDVLDYQGVPAEGQTAFWDWGRFKDPAAIPLLNKAAAATTLAERKAAYAALDKLFMQQVPVLPMMYRPLLFYEFNTTHWTGFATDQNPTAPPLYYVSALTHLQAK